MGNWGLLGALGVGLKEGVETYDTVKNQQDKLKMANNQYRAGLLEHGYDVGDDGTPTPTALTSAKQDAELQDYQPLSEGQRSLYSNALSVKGEPRAEIPEDMTAHQLKENQGLLNTGAKAQGAYESALARGILGSGGLDLRKQKFKTQAQDSISNDSDIKKYNQAISQADSDLSLMQSGKILPSQVVSELEMGLARLASGGGVASQHGVESVKFDSVRRKIQELKSQINPGTTYEALDPNQRATIEESFQRLKQSKQLQQGYRAIQKRASYSDSDVQDAHDNKISEYAPDWTPGQSARDWLQKQQQKMYGTGQTGGDHPQDAAAVAWAKANPKDPRSAEILKVNGAQ